MKCMYQVRKERLKHLHGEAKKNVSQFQSFSIRHCAIVNRMSSDLLYGAMPIQDLCVKDELVLRNSPSNFIDGQCNIFLICVCFLVISILFLMTMCFFQFYTKCVPTM